MNLLVRDVSARGFKAYINRPVEPGVQVRVWIQIARFGFVAVNALTQWTDHRGICGFRLLEVPTEWRNMIEYLNRGERLAEGAPIGVLFQKSSVGAASS